AFGYGIKQTAYDDWRKDLICLTKKTPEHPLSSLLVTFSESFSEEQLQVLRLKYDCQNTLNALKDSPISCPPPNAKLIHTYLSYFRDYQGWQALPDRSFLDSPKRDQPKFAQNLKEQ
ncbi:MAG: hypothetical protein F6K03_14525, partial [Kamptonema sp. SIO4C4]|nr:hypothetical protein [Kamptonema sp. SIO4C4]